MLLVRYSAAALVAALLTTIACGQDTEGIVDPREFGLDLPIGPVSPGERQAVTTTDDDGQPVVGRVYVRVGSSAVVLLPDGQLVGRREGQFSPTDRKFERLDKEKLTARLAAEFPGFKTDKTNHYVYVYNSSDEFRFGASRILETMLPGVKRWFDDCKINTHSPGLPLVLVMFKSEAEFRRYRRMPSGVVAYYDPLTNRVYMYEQSRLQQVRPDLALGQAISTIAHEGVHQILHNIGVQQRLSLWPMWLSEGLAEFFAPTTVGQKLNWKGPGQVNDLRMFELEQYVRGNSAKTPTGELVEHTVIAGRLTSTGYASAWALVHYLAKSKKPELMTLIRDASHIGPLTGATDVNSLGVVRSNRDAFTKLLREDFVELESREVSHLKTLPYTDPFRDAPHFVATFISTTGRKTQKSVNTFHSMPVAQKWLADMREKLPEADRATAKAEIRAFKNRMQAEAHVRQWQMQ